MLARTCWMALAAITGFVSIVAFAEFASAQQGPLVIYGQRPGGKLELVYYRDLSLIYPSHQSVLY